MTTPATALLAPWIAKGAHKELSSDEQDAYQTTIAKLLKNDELAYWFGLIKLFSGFKDVEVANELAAEFIKGVPKFPQQGNEQLLRVLAGCILAQKTESSSPSTDKIILSFLTANFSTKKEDLPIPELLTRTETLWKQECLANRALPAALSLNTIATKDKPLTPADQKKFISDIIPFFDNLDKRVAANSEETNILSWFFTSHSRAIDASFTQIGATKLAFIGAKDLAGFTLIQPGHPIARGILNKMLDSSGSSMHEVPLSEIVHELNAEPLYTDWVAEIIRPRFMASGEVITPLLYALYCHAEFSNETDWKPIFKPRAGFTADFTTNLSSFALQFYKECMLMSIIHGKS